MHVTVVFFPICSLITETRLVILAIVSIVPIFTNVSEGYSRANLFIDYFSWPCEHAHACALRDCLGVSRPFVWDTSPKCIDRESLERRRRTWGRETRDLRTSSLGRGDVKYRDAGDTGCELISQKSEVNAISVTFLVNMFWWRQPTLTSLGFLYSCLQSEDSAKTPCVEESETVVLVFSLLKYWSPMEGRVGCARQNFSRITAFDSK